VYPTLLAAVGDVAHPAWCARAVGVYRLWREAGGLVGAWPCGITSASLADFGTEIIRLAEASGPDHVALGTEIIRLAEASGPDHVALGTDLDGNYRPVLSSYDQLPDLARLLQDRGLPAAHQRRGLHDVQPQAPAPPRPGEFGGQEDEQPVPFGL